MGNKWLKCLLGTIYDLDWLRGDDTPATSPRQFQQWVAEGKFVDGAIFHQHCRYTPRLCDVIDRAPAHLVTIVRDPYDAFVSLYYWLQSRAAADEAKGKVRPKERARDRLIGKPLDDPDVLAFLTDGYGEHLRRADEWIHCGRAIVVRYEALHRDPMSELKQATDQIAPVEAERIERAIETCRADNMRKMKPKMAMHIRSATVGDSREKLSEPHLAIFRDKYADLVRALGYEVR
jgi:hypothetical protein